MSETALTKLIDLSVQHQTSQSFLDHLPTAGGPFLEVHVLSVEDEEFIYLMIWKDRGKIIVCNSAI